LEILCDGRTRLFPVVRDSRFVPSVVRASDGDQPDEATKSCTKSRKLFLIDGIGVAEPIIESFFWITECK